MTRCGDFVVVFATKSPRNGRLVPRASSRIAALTARGMLLQADGEAGDLHVWPAAAPAAWLRLVRAGFALL